MQDDNANQIDGPAEPVLVDAILENFTAASVYLWPADVNPEIGKLVHVEKGLYEEFLAAAQTYNELVARVRIALLGQTQSE